MRLKKKIFQTNIEKIKSNLINSKNLGDTKILISSDGNKKKYTIFSGYDEDNKIINQYLKLRNTKSNYHRGEISTNLNY